ncbi:DedA family protein [Amorphus sp. 3PC139-8]|uniref:DedA family protein n=1 Tax=Amorphus sp. 3PC139-8 TaxID=2735676 RepID=UPI00345DFE0F
MTAFIRHVVEEWGAAGVAFLMLLENVFPPLPSELILPLAGYAASRGDVALPTVLAGSIVGSVAGATVWFVLAAQVGKAGLLRLARTNGRWLSLTPGDVEAVDNWFDRHGGKAVLLGRMVPTVRTLISVPAALAGMGWRRFLLFTTIGSAAWSLLLVVAGYWLGSAYAEIGTVLSPISTVIVAGLILVYLYRVATFKP